MVLRGEWATENRPFSLREEPLASERKEAVLRQGNEKDFINQQPECCTVFIFKTTKVQELFCTISPLVSWFFSLGYTSFFKTYFLGFLMEYIV